MCVGKGKAIPGGWLVPAKGACYDVNVLVYLELFPPCPTALSIHSSSCSWNNTWFLDLDFLRLAYLWRKVGVSPLHRWETEVMSPRQCSELSVEPG